MCFPFFLLLLKDYFIKAFIKVILILLPGRSLDQEEMYMDLVERIVYSDMKTVTHHPKVLGFDLDIITGTFEFSFLRRDQVNAFCWQEGG